MKPYSLRTECPACGYAPLHYKSTAYSTHVVVSYRCALCQHMFDAEHSVRGAEDVDAVLRVQVMDMGALMLGTERPSWPAPARSDVRVVGTGNQGGGSRNEGGCDAVAGAKEVGIEPASQDREPGLLRPKICAETPVQEINSNTVLVGVLPRTGYTFDKDFPEGSRIAQLNNAD